MSPKRVTRPLDIYIRVSQVRGREGESFISPADQEERCRQALGSRGLEAGEVLTDLDQSGGKMDRPAFNEALERIREAVSGGVVVARLDRFGRTVARALDTIEEIDRAGGVVITAEGDFDTSTAVGELVLSMMLSLAQFELRRIRESWTTAKRRAVERGIHIAPRVPVGYRRRPKDGKDPGVLEPDGRNADTIREAYRMAARGETYRAIASYLNERELPHWSGPGVWQPNRIKRVLGNRVYLGEAAGGNGAVKADAHESLVDAATWLLAQRDSHRGPSLSTEAATVLAGLCRCAGCTLSLKAKNHRGVHAALYRCTTSQSVHGRCDAPTSINREPLEDYVLESFLARYGQDTGQAAFEDSEDDARALSEISEAQRTLDEIRASSSLVTTLGIARFEELVVDAQRRLDDAVANAPAPKVSVASGSLLEAFTSGSFDSSFDPLSVEGLVRELRENRDIDGLRDLLSSRIQAVFVRPAASRGRGQSIEGRVKIVWVDEQPLELPKRGMRWEPRPFEW